MKNKNQLIPWIIIVCLLLFILLKGPGIGTKTVITEVADTTFVTDTSFVFDTITHSVPVPKDSVVLRVDTMTVNDTTMVYIPIIQKFYETSDYQAWVSGYKPKLDSINVFQKTITVDNIVTVDNTVTVTKMKKWSVNVGLQAGVGYVSPIGGSGGVGTYIGVGVGIGRNIY